MRKEIEKFSRDDLKGYHELVDFTQKIFEKGFIELSDKPFNKLNFMNQTNSFIY